MSNALPRPEGQSIRQRPDRPSYRISSSVTGCSKSCEIGWRSKRYAVHKEVIRVTIDGGELSVKYAESALAS
jgi:hypothetical protein